VPSYLSVIETDMPKPLLRHVWTYIIIVGSLALDAAPGYGQSAAAPSPLPISASNIPMIWHADLLTSAATLSLAGADSAVRWLLPAAAKDAGARSRLVRSLELIAFDLPVSFFFVSLNHELGHEARASELGIPVRLHVVGSPWSLRTFELEPDLAFYPRVRVGGSLFDFGMESGGLEASNVLKDRLDERLLRHGRVPFSDAVTLLVAALDTPVYAATTLGPDALTDFGPESRGDVLNYVYQLRDERARAGQFAPDIRATVRGRCMLNLIDWSLWNDMASIGVWLAHGEQSRPQSWLKVGRVGLIPSMRYSLTPIGPEFSVRSHFRAGHTLGSAYVRWSEPVGEAKQRGAGVTYLAPTYRGLQATIRLDGWSHTLKGAGVRGEAGVTALNWPNRRAALSATVGAKSSGYLEGFPLAKSVYGVVGLNVAVWSKEE
jgi:hypothetical protein